MKCKGIKNSQFEERVGDLKHQDMRVTMVVHDEDALDRPPHAEVLIVILEALETCGDGGIFFRLSFFRAVRNKISTGWSEFAQRRFR